MAPSPTETLTPNQWEAFDEFVNLIGAEDRWYKPPSPSQARLKTYQDLCAAGLLEAQSGMVTGFLGLTADGRREVCQRDGHHEFNPRRPAPEGCGMCDAVVCPSCEGYGSIDCPPAYKADCANCNAAGVVERASV